jgi:hypothetical protein
MRPFLRYATAIAVAFGLILAAASAAAAHVVEQVGPYSVALGWLDEPAYVGAQNAVQVIVKDANGDPVADLASGDLTVVVSTGSQQTDAMPLDPSFDEDTGLGRQGELLAWLIPTAPGDYTFHLTGSIHGQAVDETATSSDTTFDAVKGAADAEFPTKLPSLDELSTRADRLDSRIGTASDASRAAQAAASSARDDASRALVAGAAIGGAGVILGLVALFVAVRRAPRAA